MAKIVFQNEEGQNLNRYKMTPVPGQSNIVDLERMAVITKQGTPYSKEILDHLTQVEDLTAHTSNLVLHTTQAEKDKIKGAFPLARTVVASMQDITGEGHYLIVGSPTADTPTQTNIWFIDAKQEGWGMVAVAYGTWDAAVYISYRSTNNGGTTFYWTPWKMQYSTANMITSTTAPTSFLGVGVICNVIK